LARKSGAPARSGGVHHPALGGGRGAAAEWCPESLQI
jgi:hypothetical protein